MNIKMAVFDIDGTLLAPGETRVRSSVLQAMEALRRAGVLVVVATGRALFSAQLVWQGVAADFCITSSGAYIADAEGNTLYANRMTEPEIQALVDYCVEVGSPLGFATNNGYDICVQGRNGSHPMAQDPDLGRYLRDVQGCMYDLEDMPLGALVSLNGAQIEEFLKRYPALGLKFFSFGDVVRADVDKAVAVKWLLDRQGITWEQTAAFGDSANDAAMLACAGVAVAMENGDEQLKQSAHIIAPSCAENGVAYVIQQWFEGFGKHIALHEAIKQPFKGGRIKP